MEKHTKPKVSVIIPCYNHEKYIATAIESVLNQTYTDYELIVANNGSTDGSGEIIARYAEDIQIITLEENSPPKCMRILWDMAKGDYVSLLCSDDYWYPRKLEEQMNAVRENKNCNIFFTWTEIVKENLDEVVDKVYFGRKNRGRAQWIAEFVNGGTLFDVSSLLIKNDGRYQKHYHNIERYRQLQDRALHINMLMSEEVYVVEEYLVKHRNHGGNVSAYSVETQMRATSEDAHIKRNIWNQLSDEFFIEVFHDKLLPNMDDSSIPDIMCNRILLFFQIAQKNRWLGQEALEYCWDHYYDEQVAELLDKKYGFTLDDLYKYAADIGIGKFYVLSDQHTAQSKIADGGWEILKKIISALDYAEIRLNLTESIIQSIEMIIKAQFVEKGDKLLDCYKFALCLGEDTTEAEWLEMQHMLKEVTSIATGTMEE